MADLLSKRVLTPNPSAPTAGIPSRSATSCAAPLVVGSLACWQPRPVYVCCVLGVLVMPMARSAAIHVGLRHHRPLLCPLTFFYMWWAGTSTPARFLGPVVLLLLAIPAAAWAAAATRTPRARVQRVHTARQPVDDADRDLVDREKRLRVQLSRDGVSR